MSGYISLGQFMSGSFRLCQVMLC